MLVYKRHYEDQIAIMKTLLDHGACCTSANNTGKTPFDLMAENGGIERYKQFSPVLLRYLQYTPSPNQVSVARKRIILAQRIFRLGYSLPQEVSLHLCTCPGLIKDCAILLLHALETGTLAPNSWITCDAILNEARTLLIEKHIVAITKNEVLSIIDTLLKPIKEGLKERIQSLDK